MIQKNGTHVNCTLKQKIDSTFCDVSVEFELVVIIDNTPTNDVIAITTPHPTDIVLLEVILTVAIEQIPISLEVRQVTRRFLWTKLFRIVRPASLHT